MFNAVSSIVRAATRKELEKLNILTFPSHERFESGLCKTGHEFYSYRAPGIKDWNVKYAPLPGNYTLLPTAGGVSHVFPDVDIDVILSQNKFGQFQIAKKMSQAYHIPLVSLEHTLPHPAWPPMQAEQLCQQKGHVNVFLSEYSRGAWGWGGPCEIVGPGIDTEEFTPEFTLDLKPVVLSVVNDWINRDWACGFNLWLDVTRNLPVMVIGDTPGLSQPAKNTAELVAAYRQCQVFLNTSLVSTAPFTLLEAMACGAAVVSTATTMIPQIIQDGVNGFLSNDPGVLRARCEQLLKDPALCRKLGREARNSVVGKWSFDRMAGEWDRVLRRAADTVVTGEE